MKKQRLFSFLLFCSMFFAYVPAFGQTQVNENKSDYFISLSWSLNDDGFYTCKNVDMILLDDTCIDGDDVITDNIYSSYLGSRYWHVNRDPEYLPDGTDKFGIGPGFSSSNLHFYVLLGCGDDVYHEFCYPITGTAVTDALYPPKNVKAEASNVNAITITWEKGTDMPNSKVSYYIYRNGMLIDEVSGSSRSYTDQGGGLEKGITYEYSVATVFVGSTVHISDEIYVSAALPDLTASDGTYYGRTSLNFSNMSGFADQLSIVRYAADGHEEIARIDADATFYNDYSGIPGYQYTYVLLPLDSNGNPIQFLTDAGYSKPNGIIRGTVKTLQGIGIPNVTIEITPTGGLPDKSGASPNCYDDIYCVTTDGAGYFEFAEIYYNESHQFTIEPVIPDGGTQIYSPGSVTRTLSLDNRIAQDIDFIDLTSYSVGGQVTHIYDQCGMSGISILVNGIDQGIRTDDEGYWTYAISGAGTYNFEPKYGDHQFKDAGGSPNTVIPVAGDRLDINFFDQTLRQVEILVEDGCGQALADAVMLSITNDGPCVSQNDYQTDDQGELLISLPARNGYLVTVKGFTHLNQGLVSGNLLDAFLPARFDLKEPQSYEKVREVTTETVIPEVKETLPDGSEVIVSEATVITETSTETVTEDFPTISFIYLSSLQLEIDFVQAGALLPDLQCNGSPYADIPLLQKGVVYPLEIRVFDDLGSKTCPIRAGELQIFDQVGDRESRLVRVPIENGLAHYNMRAGEANVIPDPIHPHQKFLHILPNVSAYNSTPKTYWLLVEGLQAETTEFVSTTPEIPQLILHDPPGDNSYAFVEKGTTVSSFIQSSVSTSESSGTTKSLGYGGGADLKIFSADIGKSAEIRVTSGTNNNKEQGLISTITFTENFSTSSLETFVGDGGDVYIGATLNSLYTTGTELKFDPEGCKVELNETLTYDIKSFESTFIYTENHIRNTILPKLQQNMALADTTQNEGRQDYNRNLAGFNSWTAILAQNENNRTNTTLNYEDDKNISISAGAGLSKTYTATEGIDVSHQFETEYSTEATETLEKNVGIDLKVVSGYLSSSESTMLTTTYSYSELSGESAEVTRTIGYVIEDNDIGDEFSFDVYRDPNYDTPIFRTVGGRTSCPPEDNTASRDSAGLSVYPTTVNNIPFDGAGEYRLSISNLSATKEAREYHVRVVSTSNPEGAVVRLAGNIINNSPVSVFIPGQGKTDMILTVERGPVADTYRDIEIMVYPPCEYGIWQDGGNLVNADTIRLSANFESQCAQVSLVSPGNNWIVNQASNNLLPLTIGGYDLNNPAFESVSIWVKQNGLGFQAIATIPKEELQFPFHDLVADLEHLEDGYYTVRVSANCKGGTLISYSNEISGVIDRSSIAPFGYPNPSDGFLRQGEDIMVLFDQAISGDLSGAQISLVNATTGDEINIAPQVSGSTLLINPLVDLFAPEYKGAVLKAHVHSLKGAASGNVQKYPVDWSFVVNVDPVFWDPAALSLVAPAGAPFSFDANLKNLSPTPKSFSLNETFDPANISVPEWLSVRTDNGVILPDGEVRIVFDFDTGQPPGIYQGEVVALVENEPLALQVTVEYLAETINWNVNTNAYENSMNLVMQFELVPGSNNYSADTRDRIAAFVNGEIRGVANIEYVESAQVYRAFMTVFSDGLGGNQAEEIEFRFWTALNGREYGAVETVTFNSNVLIGTVNTPMILHPAGNFQVIPLKQGWNFVSLNVNPTANDQATVLRSIMNTDNRIVIKSLTQSAEYTRNTGWQGNLKNINSVEGYMIYLSAHPDTLRVVGTPVPLPQELNVSSGWNWIGFPRPDPAPTGEILQGLTASDGDIVKSQVEFATYGAGSGWSGSLDLLQPGSGYKLKLGTSGTLTYRGEPFAVNPHNWEHNMIVTAILEDPFLPKDLGEEWILGAFIDGICRGYTLFQPVDILTEQQAFLMIYGQSEDADKVIRYRLLNTDTGEEWTIAEASVFRPNGLIGEVQAPLALSLESMNGQMDFRVVPNPVRQEALIQLETATEKTIRIDLRSMDGRIIKTVVQRVFAPGTYTHPLDMSRLAGGVYVLQLTSDNVRQVQKIIKQ